MRIIATLLLVFAFFACSDEKETKPNIEIKEEVLIEQSDEKTEVNEEREAELLFKWTKSLPEPFATEMMELYREMEERKTLEARIYKALDNMEALISHNESDIQTWLPLEYDLQMTYGNDKVAFSEYLTELRDMIREDSREKIAREA